MTCFVLSSSAIPVLPSLTPLGRVAILRSSAQTRLPIPVDQLFRLAALAFVARVPCFTDLLWTTELVTVLPALVSSRLCCSVRSFYNAHDFPPVGRVFAHPSAADFAPLTCRVLPRTPVGFYPTKAVGSYTNQSAQQFHSISRISVHYSSFVPIGFSRPLVLEMRLDSTSTTRQ